MKRRLKKETKRLEKHGTGHSASRSFTIGLISGMSQLYDRHSQFPVTFLYIAQKPAIGGFFHGGRILHPYELNKLQFYESYFCIRTAV